MKRNMKRRSQRKQAAKRLSDSKTKVVFGLLSGSSSNNVAITSLVYSLPFLSHRPDHPFAYDYIVADGVRPQELARNQLCGYALKVLPKPSDILLMMDDDMIPNETTLTMLEVEDWDIVAPLQLMFWPHDAESGRMPQCFPVAGMDDDEQPNKIRPIWPVKGAATSEVDWVGSGAMGVRRKVLEDPAMHLSADMDPPALWRNIYEANGVRIRGLDVDFCQRAKALGYRVKVCWTAHAGHFKTVDLNQVEMYSKQSFQQGNETGVRHALQMVRSQGREASGEGRVAQPEPPVDEGVAGSRMDHRAAAFSE